VRLSESASGNWLLRTLSCAGCGVVALWGFALLLGSMMGPYRLIGQSGECRSNLMRVTRAFQLYADDYEDSYPPAEKWNLSVGPYLDKPDRLRCPTVVQANPNGFGYAMDSRIAGRMRSRIDVPAKTPIVFDSSNLAANAADALKSLPKPGRHRGKRGRGEPIRAGNNIGYGDGSVRMQFDAVGAGTQP